MEKKTTDFKREKRYIVLKISDLAETELTKEQVSAFNFVCDQVAITRVRKFKKPLQCVVVESDWPEYEPTWEAIKARMTKQHNVECDGCGDVIELSKTTIEILGRPNFACAGIARKLQALGLYVVREKSEDEQAAAIHFLMSMYEKHGDDWAKEAEKILQE